MDDTLREREEKQGLYLSSSNFASISLNIPSDGIIDKQGGEGLETHYTYICTLTVIGAFLSPPKIHQSSYLL